MSVSTNQTGALVTSTNQQSVLPASHHVGPEGVGQLLVRVEVSERVCEPRVQQLGEALPLLLGEAWTNHRSVLLSVNQSELSITSVLGVSLGILEINGLMSNIHVSADNDRFLFIKLLHVTPQLRVPVHPLVQCYQTSTNNS